jgi:transcriptional regulator with XRE-family HTH domain
MLNEMERKAFSKRLLQALEAAKIKPSPAKLASLFNAWTLGPPVSVHAVRKWLIGEAIPTQEKLRTLAAALVVTPEWLRFGSESAAPSGEVMAISERELRLVSLFRKVSVNQQILFIHLMESMVPAIESPRDR